MTLSGELMQQIEDLAYRVVERDNAAPPAEWIPLLAAIRDHALREQAGQLAGCATALLAEIEEAGRDGAPASRLATLFEDSVARLQQAAELEKQQAPPEPSPLAQDPELLSDFVLESREHLGSIEAQLLVIERDPLNAEALNSVFRGFHTIKGLAGFLELWDVQKFAHEIETILDRARNSQLTITPAAIDVILQGADYLRRWVTHVEATLHNQASTPPEPDEFLRTRIAGLSESPVDAVSVDSLAAMASAVVTPPPAAPAGPPVGNPPAASSSQPAGRAQAMAVKVDTGKLDYLVDMAGELVIAESLVRHDAELAALKSPRLQRKIAQLERITAELQKTAMAMRMVPIAPLFRRMARLVRDLSRQFSKPVDLETQGDEIELDRTIVEELADPMMHMVRNALDHGIESAEERQLAGKNPVARLLLKAQHQAGQVVIEIADDGRGLNREKIVAKAVERGLIPSGEGLSDTEIHNLIFLPGFSTAAQVTSVSGRGVGMDVVRKHIERLRGWVDIRSTPGQGSDFLLKLPLTLAIIDGLVVGVGQERYIVPLFAIREMFRPDQNTIWTVQHRGEMALVRGSLLPVLRLYRKFRVQPCSDDPLKSVVLVAEIEGQRFCLLVDELIGKQEVVIKSLGELFRNVPGIAGGAILGDGRVGLILDLDRLFKERDSDPPR